MSDPGDRSSAAAVAAWRGGAILRALLVIVPLALPLAVGWDEARARATTLDFQPLNGTFQAYDPVRRLFAGERPARDFDCYLGFGPLYVGAAGTWAAGGTYGSSVRAGWFLAGAACLLAHLVLFRVLGFGWVAAAAASGALQLALHWPAGVARALVDERQLALWTPLVHDLSRPMNSSLGLRSCAPLLLAAVALVPAAYRTLFAPRPGIAADAAAGFCAGAAALWSNDYGPVSAIAFLAVRAFVAARAAGLRWAALSIVRAALAATVTVVALVSWATGGAVGEWAHYNLVGVPQDQFWYFLSTKVCEIGQIPWPPLARWATAALAVFMVLIAWRRAARADVIMAVVLAASLGAAYVTVFGSGAGERPFYASDRVALFACARLAWLATLAVARGAAGLVRRSAAASRAAASMHARGAWTLAAVLFGIYAAAAGAAIAARRVPPRPAVAAIDVPELGGALSAGYAPVVRLGRELARERAAGGVPADALLFSTYASALDVIAGARHPARNDYVIHALGERGRTRYLAALAEKKPLYVTTIRDDFTHWEAWVRKANWEVYSEIIRWYRPVASTFYNVLWRRAAAPRPDDARAVSCVARRLSAAEWRLDVALSAGVPGTRHLVELELAYETSWEPGRLAAGGIRQHLAGHAVEGGRHVDFGMPPGRRSRRVPIEVVVGAPSVLTVTLSPAGLSRLDLRVGGARYVASKADIDDLPVKN
jgi:hypothetical protein